MKKRSIAIFLPSILICNEWSRVQATWSFHTCRPVRCDAWYVTVFKLAIRILSTWYIIQFNRYSSGKLELFEYEFIMSMKSIPSFTICQWFDYRLSNIQCYYHSNIIYNKYIYLYIDFMFVVRMLYKWRVWNTFHFLHFSIYLTMGTHYKWVINYCIRTKREREQTNEGR